jgi:predicted glycosyltransferase
MKTGRNGARVLFYCHDTFGLGHLRRVRALAHALVDGNKDMSVLILSGSPIIGSFDFRARVDFVRIPGVIKLRNGEYTSLNLHIDIDETLAMRASIIRHTADIFDPDLFIVDKEPLGLRGEVKSTLQMLKKRGTPLVLGLRDVMDEPAQLAPEWERKNALPALRDLYDQIWVYGLPQLWDPMEGIDLPKSVKRKITYTGYLPRTVPVAPLPRNPDLDGLSEPYLLVTPGGGGDGEELVDWVLRAYEEDRRIPYPAMVVLGPFMAPGAAERVPAPRPAPGQCAHDHLRHAPGRADGQRDRRRGHGRLQHVLRDPVLRQARRIIVPRTAPRMEQFIRAERAQEMGLVRMMVNDGTRDARAMATALRHLPQQSLPSSVVLPGLLDGLTNVNRLVNQALDRRVGQIPPAPGRPRRLTPPLRVPWTQPCLRSAAARASRCW